MKAFCINDDNWGYPSGELSSNGPAYGETVTVVGEFINQGFAVYLLSEYPYAGGYEKDCFIPLSDIDEKELVNQREEECIS